MIVVVSHPQDVHAGCVIDLLRQDGHVVLLLDLSELPDRASLSAGFSEEGLERLSYLTNGHGTFDLRSVRSVWWRRPQAPDLSSLGNADVQAFTFNEWQEAINGLWQLIEAPWMNPPARDEVAARKMLQLKIAADLGLRIPRTLITSDPGEARAFIAAQAPGQTIFKTFSCTHAIWRETRLVGEAEMALMESVRLAPVIFQECIAPATDLRVTVVGRKLFPAAIDSRNTDYAVDFRMSLGQADCAATELPEDVERKLLALMDRLGLVYGAIDLRRTADGEHVFLEVNTAGEFLFVEQRTGQPIARAMADWLITPS